MSADPAFASAVAEWPLPNLCESLTLFASEYDTAQLRVVLHELRGRPDADRDLLGDVVTLLELAPDSEEETRALEALSHPEPEPEPEAEPPREMSTVDKILLRVGLGLLLVGLAGMPFFPPAGIIAATLGGVLLMVFVLSWLDLDPEMIEFMTNPFGWTARGIAEEVLVQKKQTVMRTDVQRREFVGQLSEWSEDDLRRALDEFADEYDEQEQQSIRRELRLRVGSD